MMKEHARRNGCRGPSQLKAGTAEALGVTGSREWQLPEAETICYSNVLSSQSASKNSIRAPHNTNKQSDTTPIRMPTPGTVNSMRNS